jgi:Mn2+/Fe2+ NRAMP family transporter
MYPYVAEERGWTTPAHRRVQQYDLLFGIFVLIVLDLAVWILGVETIFNKGQQITGLDSLAGILEAQLGSFGSSVFYLGILGTIFCAMIGNPKAYGPLAMDAYLQRAPDTSHRFRGRYASHSLYRWFVAWIVVSPLAWIFFGVTDFVGLTLLVNAAQVVLVPFLVAAIWVVTSRAQDVGPAYVNRWKDHLLIGCLLIAGCIGAYFSAKSLLRQ